MPKPYADANREISIGLVQYDSMLRDREAARLRSLGVSDDGVEILLENPFMRKRVERVSKECGLSLEQVAKVAHTFPVNEEELTEILSSGVYPTCYSTHPCRRFEFNEKVYFVPPDLCDLIKKPSNLRSFDSFPINDTMNVIYGKKRLPREDRVSDLSQEEVGMCNNLVYGYYRDDPLEENSHSGEHDIETHYQPR